MGDLIQIFVLACALSVDAASVSIAMGISPQRRHGDAIRLGMIFGLFQAGMPVLGWSIGTAFRDHISHVSSIVACVLLVAIGLKMLWNARRDEDKEMKTDLRTLLFLGVATSIDALVAGTTLTLVDVSLAVSIAIIGVVTFSVCVLAFTFAKSASKIFGRHAEQIAALLLIVLGFIFLLR